MLETAKSQNNKGFITMKLVLSFNKLQKLFGKSGFLTAINIKEAVFGSKIVQVSNDGLNIRKRGFKTSLVKPNCK